MDGREGVTPTDHDVTDLLRRTDKPVFFVVNKVDGPEHEPNLLPPFYELGIEQLWALSAEHARKVRQRGRLWRTAAPSKPTAIGESARPDHLRPPPTGSSHPARRQQCQRLS